MSAELVRFGVAMDGDLLAKFDELIERRGYATRSEALRDLVRADLAAERVAGGAPAAATLTMIYDHHVRELTEKLTAMQHELGECVVSALHVHLDADNCLEVIVLRGPADRLQSAADRMIATKGVKVGRMVVTALPTGGATHSHSHAHSHGHAHAHAHDHSHSHSHAHSHGPGHVHEHPHDHDDGEHGHAHTPGPAGHGELRAPARGVTRPLSPVRKGRGGKAR